MRNSQRKNWVIAVVIVMMISSLFAGCGNSKNSSETTSPLATAAITDSAGTATSSATPAPHEPVTLQIYTQANGNDSDKTKQMVADYKKDTGNTLEFVVVPGDGQDIYKKIDVDVASGGTVDIIPLQNALMESKYALNGWLLPLNDIYSQTGYDYESKFGKYLTKFNDNVYMLPSQAGTWAVFYNKKIFDDAHVPYPKGEWTWDQYLETAKKLTNPSKGIYGSLMPDFDADFYVPASQEGVSGYKADGSSNFDDPAFKASLKWLYDLGNTFKVQPSWLEYHSKKIPYDAMMTGKYGMYFVGTWFMYAPTDPKTYPRDWKIGVAQPPVMPDGKNNIGNMSGNGVNKNSKHPKEAAEFVAWSAENGYKYLGSLPARVDMKPDELNQAFQGIVDSLPNDDITVAELEDAYLTPNLGLKPEKITGPIAVEYNQIITQEGELYLVGQKSLDDTIKAIKTRADKAIADAKKTS